MSDDLERAIKALQGDAPAEPDAESTSKSKSQPANEPSAKAKKGREKRLHDRFRVNFSVAIRLSDGDVARARAVNLSLGGIYIEYGSPADEGREFDMLFDLPFDDAFRRVYARAKVVRSVVVGNKHVFGIAFTFTSFAKDTEKVLEKYLELREFKQH